MFSSTDYRNWKKIAFVDFSLAKECLLYIALKYNVISPK